jgi:hypothetical protein
MTRRLAALLEVDVTIVAAILDQPLRNMLPSIARNSRRCP